MPSSSCSWRAAPACPCRALHSCRPWRRLTSPQSSGPGTGSGCWLRPSSRLGSASVQLHFIGAQAAQVALAGSCISQSVSHAPDMHVTVAFEAKGGVHPVQEECRGWDVNEVVFSPDLWGTYHALMRADFSLFDEYVFTHAGGRACLHHLSSRDLLHFVPRTLAQPGMHGQVELQGMWHFCLQQGTHPLASPAPRFLAAATGASQPAWCAAGSASPQGPSSASRCRATTSGRLTRSQRPPGLA